MRLEQRYLKSVAAGTLVRDPAQERAIARLEALSDALAHYRPKRWLFRAAPPPRGLYLWGDVGRGKSLLMDMFFDAARLRAKRRVHFNAFMTEIHTAIHQARQKGADDPIPPVADAVARNAGLLCFDEFQVVDVADAMILGRLFTRLFERGSVLVATSNVAPDRLYEGGLNRQLFLPFIALLKEKLDVLELEGAVDYRLDRLGDVALYLSPLSREADAGMDAAWARLTREARPQPAFLTVFGRRLRIPRAARGVARFTFAELCEAPLAAPDYLAIAQNFHTVMIDRVPMLSPSMRNAARRFVLLIDTLYDEGVKLVCSAAAEPARLYPEGDGADAFRRTASRLAEMQSSEYLRRGHGIHALTPATSDFPPPPAGEMLNERSE
ncbi:MAG: AFG1 family ATPase [Alphaproteobacteria bacterium]|nr:AFG1 family ATPase [Alphaproteobacteria bacterium]